MEIFWIIILVLVIYIPLITLISLLRALLSLRKGKTYIKNRSGIRSYIFSLNYSIHLTGFHKKYANLK